MGAYLYLCQVEGEREDWERNLGWLTMYYCGGRWIEEGVACGVNGVRVRVMGDG